MVPNSGIPHIRLDLTYQTCGKVGGFLDFFKCTTLDGIGATIEYLVGRHPHLQLAKLVIGIGNNGGRGLLLLVLFRCHGSAVCAVHAFV